MSRDVPKEKATVLLDGVHASGYRVERWLDGPPSFADIENLVSVQIIGLKPIIRKRARVSEGNADAPPKKTDC